MIEYECKYFDKSNETIFKTEVEMNLRLTKRR